MLIFPLMFPFFTRSRGPLLLGIWLFCTWSWMASAQNDPTLQPIDVSFGKGNYAQAERQYIQVAQKTSDQRLSRYVQSRAGAALAAIHQNRQDDVFALLQEAELLIRKKKPDDITKARLDLVLGKYHLAYREYNLAMPLLENTERLSEKLGSALAAPMRIELYRSLGELYHTQGRKEEALKAFEKAVLAVEAQPHEERNYEQLADIKIEVGELYDEVLEPDEAVDRYKGVLAQKDTLLANDPERAGTLYYRLGEVYFRQKDYDAAESALNEALQYAIEPKERSDARFMLSTIYYDRGKYQLALLLNSSALDNWSPQQSNLPQENFKGFLQFGNLSKKQTTPKRAKNSYKKATQQAADWTIKGALATIGEQPLEYPPAPELSDNYNIALISYHEAAVVVPKLPKNQQVIAEIDVQMAKGALFFKTKKYSRAKEYFERALELMKTVYDEKHPMIVEATRSLSEVYLEEQIYQQAMRYIDRALEACLEDGLMPSGNEVPPIDQAKFPLELLYALGTKGKVLQGLYRESNDQKHLLQALAMFDSTVKLLNRLRRTYRREGSKYKLARLAKSFSQQASLVCDELHRLTGEEHYLYRAFDYVELAKGALLLEAIRELKARRVAGIPDSTLKKEQVLKIQISYLKGEIYYQVKQGKYQDLQRIVELEKQLEEAEARHELLIRQVEEQYPKYYDLKYDFTTVEVPKLQQLLKPDEVLLNYSLMDSVLLVLTVTNDGIASQQIPLVNRLLRYRVENFLNALQRQDRDIMAKKGIQLYQTVWQPLEAAIADKTPIIIPDGWLNNMPFDVLPKDTTSEFNYLLYDYAMVYNYSATVWALNQMKELEEISSQIAGFAPDFEKINALLEKDTTLHQEMQKMILDPLRYAKQEVSDLQQLFSARSASFDGLEATETLIKQQSQTYGVLHFATHGIVNHNDPLYSSLVFAMDEKNDGLLHTFELFGMELNASLITLSACNSGVGRLYEGEGMMSLARGFAYSGAPNLITTLWPVSDQATQLIMKNFYQYLKKGQPKHEALRQAKIDFIEAYGLNDTQANLWGGLIVVGDTEPVDVLVTPRTPWWWWLLGGLSAIILIGGGVFYTKKAKS